MSNRIETNYQSNTKSALLEEIEARKNEGSPNFGDVDDSSNKDDIVAALSIDDEHKAQQATEADTAGLPDVEEKEGAKELTEDAVPVSEFKGRYICKRDGLVYALAVVNDFIRGRTHKARNKKFSWEGTKTEFEDQFTKE